ncbi:MAG TPA: ClpXP protease specificity-enhancing factor [Candidatus Competibacteraceae bacterium]|nr:ClpXP protease specificity-enhancing factor [Candidatus Competibacteraceae bacterium]
MTSNRPYLIRALYEWIADNGMTPHLLVNVERDDVEVPREYAHEGRIVLNIGPNAVQGLQLGNDAVEFSARFGGVARYVRIPVPAVMAIYSRENGHGMVFAEEGGDNTPPSKPDKPEKKKPSLKVVK